MLFSLDNIDGVVDNINTSLIIEDEELNKISNI